ncbi:MAG: PA2779 family protein, partial [Pseudomonadota bacterium]|nr:PA2779 family protein [Pseudomonadota bacterium]
LTKTQILSELDKQEVQDKLVAAGVNIDDAKQRIQQMNQQELAQIQQEFEQMPAGSGIIGALLVVFVVLVVTDMLGATDVFGFVHNINH